mgnify:CR=1 FL=1
MQCKCIISDRKKGTYNVGTGVPVTHEEIIRSVLDMFFTKNNPSNITYAPEKISGGGCLMNIDNAKEELG